MINSHLTCTLLDALIRTCRQVKYKFTKITFFTYIKQRRVVSLRLSFSF